MSQEPCQATRKDGEPCGAWAACDDCGRCYAHCTHREQERAEARRRGGLTTAQKDSDDPAVTIGDAPPPPETLEDAAAWLSWCAHKTAIGEIGTTRARTISQLLEAFRKATERGEARRELEDVLEKLEEAVEEGDLRHLEALP